MKTVKISLDSIDKVNKFVNTINQFDTDFDLVSRHTVVDAKSILGIINCLNCSEPVELNIHDSDKMDEIMKELAPYLAK